MDVPPPVKVGACRALSELIPDFSGVILQPHALDLVSSLIDLLNNASDEIMHLVVGTLETLQAAVKAGHGILASIEPVILLSSLICGLHVISCFLDPVLKKILTSTARVLGISHNEQLISDWARLHKLPCAGACKWATGPSNENNENKVKENFDVFHWTNHQDLCAKISEIHQGLIRFWWGR